MKTTYIRMVPWMAALVCVALANGPKAVADDKDSPKVSGSYRSDTRTGTAETTITTEGAPAKFNRGSTLIGMDVKNQNGEQLGHIKDLVVDFKSEKVAYCVMSTSPKALLGINEKLLAVPLNALSISADEKHLILNADKAKVEAAAGFDKNNWPAMNNTSWGAEPFWQSSSSSTEGNYKSNEPRAPRTKD